MDMDDGQTRKKNAAILFILFWGFALFFAPSLLFLNLTPSLPEGIYVRVPASVIRKGDIVCYPPPENVLLEIERIAGERPKEKFFMKKVGAVPGERYRISQLDRSFIVGDRYIGIAREYSTSGHKMPDRSGEHVVPEGEFLPIAPNPASFDGRYTGTVPISSVFARAVPLLVFP